MTFAFQRGVELSFGELIEDTESVIKYKILAVNQSKETETSEDVYSLSPYPSNVHRKSRKSTTNRNKEEDISVHIETKTESNPENEENLYTDEGRLNATEIVSEMHELVNETKLPKVWGVPETSTIYIKQDKPWPSTFVIRKAVLRLAQKVWSRPTYGPYDNKEENPFQDSETDEEEWDYTTNLFSDLSYNVSDSRSRIARVSTFAPKVFADLRSRFGISDSAFQHSIFDAGPYVSFQSNSKGAARVGGVFFFTRDGAYMIKSIKKEEAKTFLTMLPKYHEFMKRNAPRSLLTRFCGMYGVKLREVSDNKSFKEKILPEKDEEHIFVVMNSVYPAEASHFVSERFDLKGSTVGRECSDEEKTSKGSNAVLKDLDLAREVELVRSISNPIGSVIAPEYGLHIGATAKAALLSQLRRDVSLLIDCGVMDYSLLVGVVDMDAHHLDGKSFRDFELSRQQEMKMREERRRRQGKGELGRNIVSSLTAPIRILGAPAVLFGSRAISLLESTLSTVLTWPYPYYGAGLCGVDGGLLSMMQGKRNGNKAIFYFGLIDFLQPWTTRKVLERELKGVMGYDKTAISCVDPADYAARFLEFIDAHVS